MLGIMADVLMSAAILMAAILLRLQQWALFPPRIPSSSSGDGQYSVGTAQRCGWATLALAIDQAQGGSGRGRERLLVHAVGEGSNSAPPGDLSFSVEFLRQSPCDSTASALREPASE